MDWFPDMFWLFLEWWVWPLLGLLTGLAIAWWFWRRPWRRREVETEVALKEMRHERAGLRFDLDEAQASLNDHDLAVSGLRADLAAKDARVYELEPIAASLPTLEGERDGLAARVAELEGELATVSSSSAESNNQFLALKSDFDGANSRVAALDADLAASRSRVEQLEGSLADANARVADLEPVAGRVGDLESQLASQGASTEGLQGELSAAQARIGELEGQVASANASTQELGSVRTDLESGIATRDARIAELESDAARLGAEAVDFRSSIDGKTARISELEAELNSRDSQIAELSPLKGEVSSSADRIASLEADLEAARSVSGSLQADVDAKDGRIGELEAQLNDRGQKVNELQGLVGTRETRASELETDVQAKQGRIAELEGELADANARAGQIGGLEGRIGELEGELADANARAGQVGGLQGRIGELEGELADANARAGQVGGLEGRVKELEGQLSGSAGRIGELEKELAGAKSQSTDLGNQVNTLKGRVAGLSPLEGQVSALEESLSGEKKKTGALSGDVADRDNTIASLRSDLDAAKAATAAAQQQRSALEKEKAAADAAAAEAAAARDAAEKAKAKALEAKAAADAARAEAEAAQAAAEAAMPIEIGDNDAFALRMSALGSDRDLGYSDDLKEIKGVGPKMEEMLHSNGLKTFYQVALLDQGAVNALEARIEAFPGRIRRDDWVPQAAGLHLDHHGEDLLGQVTIEPSPERQAMLEAGHADFFEARLAAVAAGRQLDYTDDLKEIKGVGPKLEGVLHDNGLRTFYQVALLDDASVDDLEDRIDTFPGRVRRDDWVPQAGQLHGVHHAEDIVDQVTIPWYRGIGPGGNQGLDARLRAINAARSADRPDDLKPIKGVGKKISDALAEENITTFYQLALLDDSSVDELEGRLGVKEGRIRNENWVPQAAQLHFETRNEEIYDLVEIESVYADDFDRQMMENARGRKFNYKDDLKLISGVGPKMEKMLNGAGLTTFLQVSLLKGPGIEALNDRLEFFPGRIERDDWVGQAAKLHTFAHG